MAHCALSSSLAQTTLKVWVLTNKTSVPVIFKRWYDRINTEKRTKGFNLEGCPCKCVCVDVCVCLCVACQWYSAFYGVRFWVVSARRFENPPGPIIIHFLFLGRYTQTHTQFNLHTITHSDTDLVYQTESSDLCVCVHVCGVNRCACKADSVSLVGCRQQTRSLVVFTEREDTTPSHKHKDTQNS